MISAMMEQGLLPMPAGGLSGQSSETPDGGPDDYDMVAEPEVVIDDGEIDRKWNLISLFIFYC